MGELCMPTLGADMDAGTVVEWRVGPGDEVHRGDVVAVIETDKSDIDAEVFEDGVVGELLVEVGRKVPVGTPLATILTSAPVVSAPVVSAPVVSAPVVSAPVVSAPVPKETCRPGEVISPLVRQLAAREGVDLANLVGSGPAGVIKRADVIAAAQRPPRPSQRRYSPRARAVARRKGVDLAAAAAGAGVVLGDDVEAMVADGAGHPDAPAPMVTDGVVASASRPRHAALWERTALLMERSNREIPHFYLTAECDFSRSSSWLDQHNAALEPKDRIVSAALLLAATARAAIECPEVNGWWIDGEHRVAQTVDLGVVVSLRDGGVLVPAIPAAETLGASELMRALHDVVQRARSGHLRTRDLTAPSITVTNLGDRGADSVLGVIYPPQLALVGFGHVVERPCAVGGLLGIRPMVTMSLAADHRASDGHRGSRFLSMIERFLQEPADLDQTR
jgi:pyruvate dehydrogenase E2 component (dihydrolipoamide acetyltransferase)